MTLLAHVNKFAVINFSFFVSNRIDMQKLAAQTAVALCLVFSVGVTSAQADIHDLLADQTNPVGTVTVTDDGTVMTVEYEITDADWCITQTHLAIEEGLADIPQTGKYNPIPGQFEFNDSWNCVPSVTYTKGIDPNTPYFVAAHAVVYDVTSGETLTIVSDTSTAVTEVNDVPVAQNAVEAYEPSPSAFPDCDTATILDDFKSLWDKGIGGKSATFTAAGADWIWNTANPEHVIDGDVVTFQETFDCSFATGGSILITADNGYYVGLNGTVVGSAQLFEAFPGSMKQDGVDSNNWQSVETLWLDGKFVNGENTLTIVAANEYQNTDDILSNGKPQKFPGTGIGGTSVGDNVCRNPGALIFKATVEGCLTDHETAWGVGERFTEKGGWGTYFTYITTAP